MISKKEIGSWLDFYPKVAGPAKVMCKEEGFTPLHRPPV
jgi:hypothetical protein